MLLTNTNNNDVGVDVMDGCGVDYKIQLLYLKIQLLVTKYNCCVSGTELVDTLKLIIVQVLMFVVMLIIIILITIVVSQAPSWWTACSMW